MRKRKLFFIKKNFQLRFILGCVFIVASGILLSTVIIFSSLRDILEQTIFSSHLNFESSRELFWESIMKVHLQMTCITLLICLVSILYRLIFLKFYFYTLAKGLDQLAKGKLSIRLPEKDIFSDRGLVKDFNQTAAALQKRAEQAQTLLDTAINVIDSQPPDVIQKLKTIHSKLRVSWP